MNTGLPSEVVIALISSIAGAIIGSLITVFSDVIIRHFQSKNEQKKNLHQFLTDWLNELRQTIFDFDLSWSVWITKFHMDFDEPKQWIFDLIEGIKRLRSHIGPCVVRNTLDSCAKELTRIYQLGIEYVGQGKEAYGDFEKTVNASLEKLKSLDFMKKENINIE